MQFINNIFMKLFSVLDNLKTSSVVTFGKYIDFLLFDMSILTSCNKIKKYIVKLTQRLL